VLLIGNGFDGGGAQTHFRVLARNLFGGSADVAIFDQPSRAELRSGQALFHLGWNGKHTYPRVAWRLRKILRKRHYDAALALGLYPSTVLWAATRVLRRRPALVMMEITRPILDTKTTGRVVSAIRHFLYRVGYRAADLVAANSEDGVLEISAHYGIAAYQLRRAPNIIELERVAALARETAYPPPKQPSLCIVARLDPMKRVDTLLQAASKIRRDLDWQIDLVGDGAYRPTLEAIAKGLGIADRVIFHGWLENPYPLIARAIATVNSSAYEGFSNSVLESMVLRTPVITSLCSTDARQMSALGATLGFEVGDHEHLRAHVETLLTDPSLRKSLTDKAWRYAAIHHVAPASREYETLIHDAILIARCGSKRTPSQDRQSAATRFALPQQAPRRVERDKGHR
jgi:glycosyltransferase involved in cell wall biosynthesis